MTPSLLSTLAADLPALPWEATRTGAFAVVGTLEATVDRRPGQGNYSAMVWRDGACIANDFRASTPAEAVRRAAMGWRGPIPELLALVGEVVS